MLDNDCPFQFMRGFCVIKAGGTSHTRFLNITGNTSYRPIAVKENVITKASPPYEFTVLSITTLLKRVATLIPSIDNNI